jgi:hypothetical protein
MKYKTTITIIAIAIALAFFGSIWGRSQNAQSIPESPIINASSVAQGDSTNKDSAAARLADQIIVGLVSEKQFMKMNLSSESMLEVFKHIRDQRSWGASDEDLAETLNWYQPGVKAPGSIPVETPASTVTPAASGPCRETIELENGSAYAAYPYALVRPSGSECTAGDTNDRVLVYNTPKWPHTDSRKVRIWSNLWWVRWVLGQCNGGALGNNVCTPTTRVCIGRCVRWSVPDRDLYYLYLWHK